RQDSGWVDPYELGDGQVSVTEGHHDRLREPGDHYVVVREYVSVFVQHHPGPGAAPSADRHHARRHLRHHGGRVGDLAGRPGPPHPGATGRLLLVIEPGGHPTSEQTRPDRHEQQHQRSHQYGGAARARTTGHRRGGRRTAIAR